MNLRRERNGGKIPGEREERKKAEGKALSLIEPTSFLCLGWSLAVFIEQRKVIGYQLRIQVEDFRSSRSRVKIRV